jgi:hypothetical protein
MVRIDPNRNQRVLTMTQDMNRQLAESVPPSTSGFHSGWACSASVLRKLGAEFGERYMRLDIVEAVEDGVKTVISPITSQILKDYSNM